MRVRNGVLAAIAVLFLTLEAQAETLRVTARAANLRATASTDSKIVTTVPQGTTLEVIETAGAWYKVKAPNGITGFAHKSVVSADGAPSAEPTKPASPARPTAPAEPEEPGKPRPRSAPAPAAAEASQARATAARAAATPAKRGGRRFKFLGDLILAPLSLEYTQNKTFREYNEDASLTVQHKAKLGFGASFGLQYDFSEHLGAILTLGLVNRSASATYDGALPHPLYFNEKRSISGEVSGATYRETTAHLDAAYLGKAGSLSYAVFAGPSYFSLSADLVGSVQYSQSYPYDTVTVTSVPTSAETKTGIGFNVGADVDYSLGGSLSLGGQLRYSRATVTLEPGVGDKAEIDAGGLQVSLGVRVRF
jgi:opacity protein-like surface antigen